MESDIVIPGIALDIDDTLGATNRFWAEALAERFGKPDHLSHDDIILQYRYMEKVPFWQTAEAFAWMEEARNSDDLQEAIPLIENADRVIRQVQEIVPICAYITARPQMVRKGTLNWLARYGFPAAPLIMRPDDLGETHRNEWKAGLLAALYPAVRGIIDDNAGLLQYLPSDYKGTVFLYDNCLIPDTGLDVVAVKDWDAALPAVRQAAHRLAAPHVRAA